MKKSRLILLCILAAGAAWLLWQIDYVALWSRIEAYVSSAVAIIALAGAMALIVGVTLFVTARRRADRAQRANDDALRVLRMQQRKQMAESALPKATPSGTHGVEETAPTPSIETPAKPLRKSAPRLVVSAPRHPSVLSDGIYFQPIVHAPTGDVGGFAVYRKTTSDNGKAQFVHHPPHGTKVERAKIEAHGVEQAASEARRVLAGGNSSKNQKPLHIDVPISAALLTDRVRLKPIISLMCAHPALRQSIRLMIDGGAVHRLSQPLIDGLDALRKAGVALSLNITGTGAKHVDDRTLDRFDALFVSKNDVQQGVMRHQAEASADGASRSAALDEPLFALLDKARQRKISIIASGIVSESDVVDMLAEDIVDMSGSLFGEPRAIRSDLLTNSHRDASLDINRAG